MWVFSYVGLTALFGLNGRLERRLRRSGRVAVATVLSTRERVPGLYDTANPGAFANDRESCRASPSLWEATVRVQPERESPFDAIIYTWLNDRPAPQIRVLYDPRDHRKVVLDRSGPY